MAHPNVDRYRSMMAQGAAPDEAAMREALSEDVRWHEAGNPHAYVGRDAVLARLGQMMEGTGGSPQVTFKSVLGDDDSLVAVGHASFDQAGQHLEYDFVEYYAMADGKVTERWSFMDAVPGDVAAFFPQ